MSLLSIVKKNGFALARQVPLHLAVLVGRALALHLQLLDGIPRGEIQLPGDRAFRSVFPPRQVRHLPVLLFLSKHPECAKGTFRPARKVHHLHSVFEYEVLVPRRRVPEHHVPAPRVCKSVHKGLNTARGSSHLPALQPPLQRTRSPPVMFVVGGLRRGQKFRQLQYSPQHHPVPESLRHVCLQLSGDCQQHPNELSLGVERPPTQRLCKPGRVPPRDVLHLVLGEGNDVRELLAPAGFVDERHVANRLTGVAMEPALLRVRKHLGPDVIGPVEHVARVEVQRSAAEGEAVGPFAAAASPGLQELSRMVVPWESLLVRTARAGVQFHAGSVTLAFLWRRLRAAGHLGRCVAVAAVECVHPVEEGLLEPMKQLEEEKVVEAWAGAAIVVVCVLSGVVGQCELCFEVELRHGHAIERFAL
uniref:Putative secreted protein n=1 Tax=Ixodes ricinus TaxID=34613 RepID=A0A6B0VAC8_IXORI